MRILLLFICFLSMGMGGGAGKPHLADFTSDGCSLFPDKNLISNVNWCECCFQHDISYWKGGTATERDDADKALRTCILKTTDDEKLADAVYAGVRFGGSPYFYNWYRWGYGWDYGRGYAPLTDKEREEAEKKLADFFEGQTNLICK